MVILAAATIAIWIFLLPLEAKAWTTKVGIHLNHRMLTLLYEMSISQGTLNLPAAFQPPTTPPTPKVGALLISSEYLRCQIDQFT